jgi:putative superfamily III holin-X
MTGPVGGAGMTDAGRRDVTQTSVGDLVGEVTRDLSTLMRQELRLAKAELREEAGKTAGAAGLLGGAGLAGYMVLLFASIAVWWGLSNVMDQSWAALIVAAVWAVVGVALYASGRRRLSAVNPTPERTAETLREIPDAIRGR